MTETQTPTTEQSPVPSWDDLQAIATRVEEAASRAENATKASAAATSAARDEADKRSLELPQEVIDGIAAATVAAFSKQFELSQQQSTPDPGETPAEAPEAPAEAETPKTFAERFLGL